MKTRIITGIWAGAIFLALLYIGGLPFLAFMAILTILGYTELVRMRQWSGSRIPRILFGIGTLLPFVGIYEETVDRTLPIGLSPIAWASFMGTWVKPIAEVKNDAPAIIKAIMQAVRTAANSESVNIARLK